MKCPVEKVGSFIEKPDLSLSGALIYGEDSFLVGTNKRVLLKNAVGENDGDDLYILTLDPARVKRDEELVHSVLTSRSLLPGRRVALLESATNEHTKSVARALEDPDPEDAFLIVVAGDLKTQSTLRKLFESAAKAIALPSVAKPPTVPDLRQRFRERNMPAPTADALDRLVALAGEISWGEFESLFEKLSLYMRENGNETTVADIDACAPFDRTVQVDELVDALATGDRREVARLLRALADRGTGAVTIAIQVTHQFQHMHRAVASAQGSHGIRSALYRQPMHPLRRRALDMHCRRWKAGQLESALLELHTADMTLRALNSPAPFAVLERALMRITGKVPGQTGSSPSNRYRGR